MSRNIMGGLKKVLTHFKRRNWVRRGELSAVPYPGIFFGGGRGFNIFS
jgi:hypothetical protein